MMIADVRMWGKRIGVVAQDNGESAARFEYDEAFVSSGIEPSPVHMPLSSHVYQFPSLVRTSFRGLPGLLSDSLPDKFGNALIDEWLAMQGRSRESMSPVERLCYTGARGMGCIEYIPSIGPTPQPATSLEVDALVQIASDVLSHHKRAKGSLKGDDRGHALHDILLVGTSAAGARAKAVIAWNPDTNEVRSGQVDAPSDFQYWILKFDGVRGNRDKELDDPVGYGAIEYAYSLMARASGISMQECRLFEENGRRHFMTKRFDRLDTGEKLHVQSLGALEHVDYNEAGMYSYEQALLLCKRLNIPMSDIEQLFRRMVFNVVARNQDDHVKNISFLMNKQGAWKLAPAYDVTYSYNPNGLWTSLHQMSINGKRDGFTMADIESCAKVAGLVRGRHKAIVQEIVNTVSRWQEFADEAQVNSSYVKHIGATHRLSFLP